MKYRTLGKSGIEVSELGIGTWPMGGNYFMMNRWMGYSGADDDESVRAIRRAGELGVNFIDTADVYGLGRSERVIAKAIEGGRDKWVIATKGTSIIDGSVGLHADFSYEHLIAACNRSLKRLNTDRIDVYQLHSPGFSEKEKESAFRALSDLKRHGKILLAAVSIGYQYRIGKELIEDGLVDALQVYFNLLDQQAGEELVPLAQNCGVGILASIPFATGLLTGKYKTVADFPEDDYRNDWLISPSGGRVTREERLKRALDVGALFEKAGYKDMIAVACKFLLSFEGVSTIIPGIRTVAHIESNAAAVEGPDIPAELFAQAREMWRKWVAEDKERAQAAAG
jgi:aryl-alcohol dehydrogenase-like predicted oxidoreductase